MKILALDVEATSLDPKTCRIIEIAVVDHDTDEVLLHTHLDPERPIPPEIVEITKITDEMVRGKPKFKDICGQLNGLIYTSGVIVGYNPFFDRTMINAEFARLDMCHPTWPLLICAKRLWDICEPREKRNLTNAYKRFVDDAGFDGAHGALADTQATLKVLRAQRKTFDLEGLAWDQLDPEVKLWWGPSDHILLKDEQLLVNFGKNAKKRVEEVDRGYWAWVERQDFPDHVLMMALKVQEMHNRRLSAGWLLSWAKDYR